MLWKHQYTPVDLSLRDKRLTVPGIGVKATGLEGRYHGRAVGA